MTTSKEHLPLYQSHKTVRAVKIAIIEYHRVETDGAAGLVPSRLKSATIFPADPGIKPFEVSAEYVNRHAPHHGGYYVLYEDGYESFSPAGPFESGYIKIGEVDRVEDAAFIESAIAVAKEYNKRIVALSLAHSPANEPCHVIGRARTYLEFIEGRA